MNIFQFFRILWARRLVVMITTVACLVAGAVAALILPRTYTATSRVMVDLGKPDPTGSAANATTLARGYIPTEAQVIMDYRVAARAAENLGWTRDPAQQAAYRNYRDSAGGGADVLDFDHWIAQPIMSHVTAVQFQQTNFIDITYSAPNPNDAAVMANAVRQAYIDEATASTRRDALQAVDVLSRQMDEVRTQAEAAGQKLVAFQRATGVVLLNDDTDAASSRLQALANAAPVAGQTMMIGGSDADPRAGQLAAIDARINTEAASLGPNHPLIQELRRQRAAIASVPIASSGRSVRSGPSIEGAVSAESAKVLAQRDKVEEAKRLSADVKVLQEQYLVMAGKAAALRQQSTTSDFSIVPMGNAVPPGAADSPKVPLILGGSFGFGLGAGLLIALIMEFMRRRVRGVEDLTASAVPIIGVINAPKNTLSFA